MAGIYLMVQANGNRDNSSREHNIMFSPYISVNFSLGTDIELVTFMAMIIGFSVSILIMNAAHTGKTRPFGMLSQPEPGSGIDDDTTIDGYFIHFYKSVLVSSLITDKGADIEIGRAHV